MRKPNRKWMLLGSAAFLLLTVPILVWLGLSYRPAFYRKLTAKVDPDRRHAEAEKFVAMSLRLRNDIVNESRWEAVFTDDEVNAWLAEDLVAHFADQIPEGVRDPRVLFDVDRLTLAFELENGPVHSVVWVVMRVDVPKENEVALTIEKIRAGALPIPSDELIDRITAHALSRGLDLTWERRDGQNVAIVRYTADPSRRDVVLERLEIAKGRIRLSGRSSRAGGPVASPTLPTRRVLQSTFPRRTTQRKDPAVSLRSGSTERKATSPL
jgi:hypothetical protein